MKIKLVNNRIYSKNINIALTAKSKPIGLSGIEYNTTTPWSAFLSANPGALIEIVSIDGGRLYVGSGAFPLPGSGESIAPVPDGTQYYGWIEFSKLDADNCVYVNLSNVDIAGLPLTLSGNTLFHTSWKLGYKTSMASITSQIKTRYPSSAITCSNGALKVVAPNIRPESYATSSFDPYLKALTAANAQLAIYSDVKTPNNEFIVFAGGFSQKNQNILLEDAAHNKIEIKLADITSDILYKCDGGYLYYTDGFSGVTTKYPQNRTPENDPTSSATERNNTNSVFRNIVTAFNEGYLEESPLYSNKINYSNNFSYLRPFAQKGRGNPYAKVLFDNSNSYGFPYADGNLKTLIQASPDDVITMTLIDDEAIFDYDDAVNTENKPNNGQYQFGIGGYSQQLGYISIGNCRYPASVAESGTGGYLPSLSGWFKMHFHPSDQTTKDYYIFVNEVTQEFKVTDAKGTACLLSNGNPATPIWDKEHKTLTWAADMSWNPAADCPPDPQGYIPE